MKILTYDDLVGTKSEENNEPMVDLGATVPEIVCVYEKTEMIPFLGESIYVRETVAKKLAKVNQDLQSKKHQIML